MNTQIICLNDQRNVTMTTYLWENSKEFQDGIKRPLIVVCPGGGYSFLSDREADPIALKFLAAGFNAVVLRYGIKEYAVAPGPLRDIAGAVAYIRKHADEWFVDKDNIFVCGFSAGAHVAGQLGVFWNNRELLGEGLEPEDVKPNGMILSYPVLDLRASATHLDIGAQPGVAMEDLSIDQMHPKMPKEKIFVFDEKENRYFVNFENAMNAYIFDGEYTDEQEDFYSLQNQISADTPETFLWHAAGDGLIFPINSVEFAAGLIKAGVDYELHIYSGGGHGVSRSDYVTANDYWQYYTPAAGWIDLAVEWLNRKSGFRKKIAVKCNRDEAL